MSAFKNRIAPQLNRFPGPNSVVVIDNCGVHNPDELRAICSSYGAILQFLPPYSPDFNPIELVFGQVKRWMRRWGDLYGSNSKEIIYKAFEEVTTADVRAYIKHSGYGAGGQ